MGIEDRDWFREVSAEKKGMRYNAKNATYSKADKFSKKFSEEYKKESKKSVFLLLQIGITFAICLFVFVVFMIISKFLR